MTAPLGYRSRLAKSRLRVKKLRAENKALRWQVANWERKEVLRATCCVEHEKALRTISRMACTEHGDDEHTSGCGVSVARVALRKAVSP